MLCIERPLAGCPPNEIPCGTTQNCYPLGAGCDGIDDCINGEDEVNCGKKYCFLNCNIGINYNIIISSKEHRPHVE